MNIEQIQQLLRQQEPEDLKLDFKRELYEIYHPDSNVRDSHWGELIKDVLALANGNVGTAGKPGYLVIGVANELNQHGTRELYDVGDVNLTGQQVLDRINAICRPHLPNVYCDTNLLDGIRILVITVPPTPHLHETIRALKTPKSTYPENTVFIRRKEGVGVASTAEREAIKAEKQVSLLNTKVSEGLQHERLSFPLDLIQRHRESLAAVPRYTRWADKSPDEAYIHSAGIHLPLFVSPYEDIGGPSEDLLECIRSYHRLIILGEPGMGKTVALERAIWEFSTLANNVVPVLVPLIQYDGSLISTIIVALNESGVLSVTKATEVEQLILGYQCVFLFDGLNEVPGSYRDKLYAELASFIRAHLSSPCVITSRSQDSLWRRFHSREMIEDAFVVRRIPEEQISEYLIAHLGEQQGKELFDRLNEALRGLARVPLLLWLIKEAGAAGEELPGNRGGLFNRFVRQVLKREQKQPALTTVPPHQKIQILSHLAFYLQQDHRLACLRDEALRVIQKSYPDIEGAVIVDESLRNGLLIGETHLHFMHQAVQEYFAAVELNNLITSYQAHERHGLKKYSQAVSFKRQFHKWATDNWWSEVIVQLAGITDQSVFVARQVFSSNPWLAYWCSIEGQPLDAEVQAQIEQKTVARLGSSKEEERFRVISELARMENPRTINDLILALGDTVARVQELAGQTLARLGEPSVNLLLDSLTITTAEKARWAATRTLGAIWHLLEIVELGSEEIAARRLAAEALGSVGDDRAILPLIAALQDSDEGVRRNAAEALGKLGDRRAIEPLMRALKLSYAQTRSYESSTIAQALAALGEYTGESLLAELRDTKSELDSDDPEIRGRAVRKLGDLSDEHVSGILVATLKDDDQLVRWEATKSLGRIWRQAALIELGDADPQIRRVAARTLGRQRDAQAIEPLIAALYDRDPTVRETAADALGVISIGALAALLYHRNREIRQNAGRALVRSSNDKVDEILISAVLDHRRWVCETAADVLVKRGDRGVPILEIALQDDDPEVRKLARLALRRIGTVKAQTVLRFGGR